MKIKTRRSNKKRVRMLGFRSRMKTRGGRAILRRRRKRGRSLGIKLGP